MVLNNQPAQSDPRERMTSDQQNIADTSFQQEEEVDADETDDLEDDTFLEEDEETGEETL